MTAVADWAPHERLMLIAAIGEPEASRSAYAQWRELVDLDALEGGALRVLPLLHELAEGDDDPVQRKLGKVVRFSWLKSQLLTTRVLPSIQALQAGGVPVMLAKGAAVTQHTHGELHLRPMDDFDIVVKPSHTEQAVRILSERGWVAPSMPTDPRDARIMRQVHAIDFADPSGALLDLHWQVIHGSLHHAASWEFWDRAGPGQLRDTELLVLSREDTLVQVLGHGQRINAMRPLQWITDAALLLRGDPSFDWTLAAQVAERHRVSPAVATALTALREIAPSLVPERLPPTLRRIRRAPRSGSVQANWAEFVARSVHPRRRVRPGHAVQFAKEAAGVDRVREAPAYARWWGSGRRGAPPAALPSGLAEPLEPGEVAGFTAKEAGTAMLGPGWWASDAHGTWSRGRECSVVLTLSPRCAPLAEVQLSLVPFLAGVRRSATIDVYGPGGRLARWRFAGELAEHTRIVDVPVPPGGGSVTLRFVTRDRISPTDAGASADHRPLSFALRSVRIGLPVPRPPYTPLA